MLGTVIESAAPEDLYRGDCRLAVGQVSTCRADAHFECLRGCSSHAARRYPSSDRCLALQLAASFAVQRHQVACGPASAPAIPWEGLWQARLRLRRVPGSWLSLRLPRWCACRSGLCTGWCTTVIWRRPRSGGLSAFPAMRWRDRRHPQLSV